MAGWLRRLCVALVLIGPAPNVGLAQEVRSPILTIDSDHLYSESAFGQRVLREIEAQTTALAEENRTLEAQLETEERALTAQRDAMAAAEFRALADAFDARVRGIRTDREASGRAIVPVSHGSGE